MGLLHDIQAELLDSKAPIAPILLKLRYLAAKLGSDVLEEWVRYETEGYPKGVDVPEYRKAHLTYHGTFTDGFRTLNHVPIPEYIIRKEAGDHWLEFPLRDSIAVIDKLLIGETPEGSGKFGIAAGNLIPVLHGKVFEGMGAITIQSTFAGVICPLLSGPISILELATKEEWNGKEAQAGRDHRQAA